MKLSDLIPSLQVQVNGPGGSYFNIADEDGWLDALTNAFWTGRLRGFFSDYRISVVDDDTIVNVVDDEVEMDRMLAQVIVLYAAYGVLKAKFVVDFESMKLSDLIPSLQVQVNGPGGSYFNIADEDGWLDALTNAFWTGRLRGFFSDYRISVVDDDTIVNVVDDEVEMDRMLAQVIVLYAAYGVLKAKFVVDLSR